MPAGTRKHKQHGVEVMQINYSGNWYTPVEQRILIANHADPNEIRTQPGYSVIEHAIIPVDDRWAYTCRIEYPRGSGCLFPGSDFIDTKAKDGLAKAETSAIGRALGLAGIAIEGGIASAEEMQQAQSERTSGPHGTVGWNPLSDTEFRRRCRGVGRVTVTQVEELVDNVTPAGSHPHRERCFEALAAEEQRAREVTEKVGRG